MSKLTTHIQPLGRALVLMILATAVSCRTIEVDPRLPVQEVFADSASTVQVSVTDSLVPLMTAPQPPAHGASRWREILLGPEQDNPRSPLLRTPEGMAVCRGDLYICDPGIPDIVVINLASGHTRRWTSFASRPASPLDIAFDESGLAYVTDTTQQALLVYDHQGNLLRSLKPPDAGNGPGFHPTAVLTTSTLIYVSDPHRRRIDPYLPSSNEWLPPITSAAAQPLAAPVGLAMTAKGDLLIADALAGVVHRIDTEGNAGAPLGERGRGPGQFVRPMHVACTNGGFVWVSDAARQSMLLFREGGEFLLEVAGRGSWNGFTLPIGVVVHSPAPPENAFGGMSRSSTSGSEWVIVSDPLGTSPLTLLTLTALATSEDHASH